MNELLELLPMPAERDIPPNSFELRKAQLVGFVERDLRTVGGKTRRLRRLRGLRVWLMSIGIILALIAGVKLNDASDSHGLLGSRLLAEATVAAASGSSVVFLLAGTRPRSDGISHAIIQRRAIGAGHAIAWAVGP